MLDGHLEETNLTSHHNNLKPKAWHVTKRPYRARPKIRKVVVKEIDRMCMANTIKPAIAEWASLMIIVRMNNGSYRMCNCYRQFNAVAICEKYALFRKDEYANSLSNTVVFSTLQVIPGYWKMPAKDEGNDKTIFFSHRGTYRFNQMWFRLTNVPATFQQPIDILQNKYAQKSCLQYL